MENRKYQEALAANKDFLDEARSEGCWPARLEKELGFAVAYSLQTGLQILHDYIRDDLAKLHDMPAGTHIGELEYSMTEGYLPNQFLMKYDYDFLFRLNRIIERKMAYVEDLGRRDAHRVIDEIIFRAVNNIANSSIDDLLKEQPELKAIFCPECDDEEEMETEEDECVPISYYDWVYDTMFDDADVDMLFIEGFYFTEDDNYHFSHWFEDQFWM